MLTCQNSFSCWRLLKLHDRLVINFESRGGDHAHADKLSVDLWSGLFPQWMIEHRIKEEMKVSVLPSEPPCFFISFIIFPIFCSSAAILQNSGMDEHFEPCYVN